MKTFGKIVYENIYPHIDWVLYTGTEGFKYDFIVHPGGNPADILIHYTDADVREVNGGLQLITKAGTVSEGRPLSYQGPAMISNEFSIHGNEVSFHTGDYNKSEDLVIDPLIVWATYYGTSADESGGAICTDNSENVYLSGSTASSTEIASGGFQDVYGGGTDAMLIKFDAAGNRIWGTYYGGSGGDGAHGCAYDPAGFIYLSGSTTSTSGIAYGGFQNTTTGIYSDAFLVKFNEAGSRIWATYYGGSNSDDGSSCATDDSGHVYLSGFTHSSSGIATSDGFQSVYSLGYEAFLVKFDSTGGRIWATYYGGTAADYGNYLVTDHSGNIYLTGTTGSTSGIASPGAFQDTVGSTTFNTDAFLVKFSPACERLWGTYYGGAGLDDGGAVALDADGNVYMAGTTRSSTGMASPGSYDTTLNGTNDAFLVKFDSLGNRYWGTYYGGYSDEDGGPLAIDDSGNIYMGGHTGSTDAIAYGGFDNIYSYGGDAWLVKFSGSMTRLWGTYYGGNYFDVVNDIVLDNENNLFVSGQTRSSWGITTSGYDTSFGTGGTGYDLFLAKINACVSTFPAIIITPSDSEICKNTPVFFSTSLTDGGAAPGWQWFKNGVAIPGEISDTLLINGLHNGDVITCQLTTDATCALVPQPFSNAVDVAVNFLPTPGISNSGIYLSTGVFNSYQWYLNGSPVPGATHQFDTAAAIGWYKVYVTDANGCSSFSDSVQILSLGIPATFSSSLHLYPNPTRNELTIEGEGIAWVDISDISGNKMLNHAKNKEINISSWAPGIYFINAFNDKGFLVATGKFVRMD